MDDLMSTAFLTYAWTDNSNSDVDYVAQELEQAGLKILQDKYTLGAGRRIWEQIGPAIQDPSNSDAWIIYATQASLTSEGCLEELAYALDRALSVRGAGFPLIGVFPAQVDSSLIPAAIRTRIYVSLTDPDWKERVVAAAEGRSLAISRQTLEPYFIKVHELPPGGEKFAIEVRPRAGTWNPFTVAIKMEEQAVCRISTVVRAPNSPRGSCAVMGLMEGVDESQGRYFRIIGHEATPTNSGYIYCSKIPSELMFGAKGGMMHAVKLERNREK